MTAPAARYPTLTAAAPAMFAEPVHVEPAAIYDTLVERNTHPTPCRLAYLRQRLEQLSGRA